MSPRVTVLIANFNYERYIAAAVRSVLEQSYSDLELIVVDDGSTDRSVAAIEPFAADRRVRIVRLNHVGQCRAKNEGLALARGEMIAFLDADDIWHPEKLERQMAIFDADPNVGVVYARRTLIDGNGNDLPFQQPPFYRGAILFQIFRANFICFSSAIVRRGVFEHIGLFDPSIDLAVDYDLWLRIANHYHFDYVDAPLVKYRIGHGNLSRRAGERLTTVLLLMRRFLFARRGNRHLEPKVVEQALGETYCNMGFSLRPFAAYSSGIWFLRALAQHPGYGPAWRGLLSCVVPPKIRRVLRGERDWQAAYCTAENDPRNV